jgi:hypothetical protein
MQTQSWNTLIEWIKLKLGSPINQVELSDDQMHNYILDHVLPEISQFSSDKRWVAVGPSNVKTDVDVPILNRAYTIPLDDEYTEIIDVHDVYYNKWQGFGMTANSVVPVNPVDYAMYNELTDIASSFMPVKTWEFRRPDTLIFSEEIKQSLIVEVRTSHKTLATIPSDVYHEIFKPMCLGHMYLLLASFRSKYERLGTPFGDINLNWQELQQRGDSILQQVQEKLDAFPPDILIEIF